MNLVFGVLFVATIVACALWLPWWAAFPSGWLVGWLLPGIVGVAFGLMERQR